ncbi:TPA: transglycosylase domain-containing protein [Providencia alcalifaciens]|nr:transglycosylase domain-containing protein [Providencia alcalifaciens]
MNLRKLITSIKRAKGAYHNYLVKMNSDLYQIENKFNGYWWVSHDYTDLHFHVIAIEDRRFFEHYGVDILSVIKNLVRMITFREHGGASTIEMQLVRTITKHKNKTFARKINEIILSIAINRKYSKLQILNCYLNYAYFGAYMNGVNEAINYMFHKEDIEDLTIFESSMIAAMLQQPRPKKPSVKRELILINRAVHTQRRAFKIKEFFYKSNITRDF